MKSKFYIIAISLIGCLLTSCDKDGLEYQNDFEKSQKAWANFKESTDNSYKYKVVGGSWVGYAWETGITVVKGKITQRHFKYTTTNGLSDDVPVSELEWTEVGNEIGIHKFAVALPLTLDEIYDKAEQEWLIKRKDTKTYFETENNGLISTCGFVENGCADDCFIGIHIKSIERL